MLEGPLKSIENRQAEIEALHAEIFGKPKATEPKPPPKSTPIYEDDQTILERAYQARNGEKTRRLMAGDHSGYESQSEADLALCDILSFWFGNDPVCVDRIFRSSELLRPKWDEKHHSDGRTYGEITIQKAISRKTETHQGPHVSDSEHSATTTRLSNTNRQPQSLSLDDLPEAAPPLPKSRIVKTDLSNDLLNPGGLIGALKDYTERASAKSIEAGDLLFSIVAMGALLGQRIQSPTGLRTNLYACFFAPSGSGKNSFRKISGLIARSVFCEVLAGTKITSAAAIIAELAESPVLLAFWDEIGEVFKGLRSKNVPQYLQSLIGDLLELYTITDSIMKKPYADNKKTIHVKNPCFSFCGTATQLIWDSLAPEDTGSGLIPRTLFVEAGHNRTPPKNQTFDDYGRMLDHLETLNDKYPSTFDDNGWSDPLKLSYTDGATTLVRELEKRYSNLSIKLEGDLAGRDKIYTRAVENLIKIAMIHEISEAFPERVERIGEDSIQYGAEFIDASINTIVQRIDDLGGSEYGRELDKAVGVIQRLQEDPQKSVKGWAKYSDMSKRLRKPSKALKSIIETLIEQERVEVQDVKLSFQSKKPARLVRVVG